MRGEMKNFFAILISALTFLFSAQTDAAPYRIKWTADEADLNFAVALLKNEARLNESNFIISPVSAYTAAVILAQGCDGQSLDELRKYILTDSVNVPTDAIADMTLKALQTYSKGAVVNITMWGEDFNNEYKKVVGKFADIRALPLKTDYINKWMNTSTKGEISGMLKSEWTDKKSVYYYNITSFKDKWADEFDWHKTKSRNFYSYGKQKPVKVNTMYARRFADYYEDDKMQAIRLWFQGNDFIEIFLPRRTVRFKKFMHDLQSDDLKLDYEKADVKIYIPRFEINSGVLDLRNIFGKFHVAKVFDPQNKDYDKMSSEPHTIQKIVAMTGLRVDETGTEALPVPEDDEDETKDQEFGELPPKVFNADRPFVFMVSGGLLIGTYTQGEEIARLIEEDEEEDW